VVGWVIAGAVGVGCVVAFRALQARVQRQHDREAAAFALLGVKEVPEEYGRARLSGDRQRIAQAFVWPVLEAERGVLVDWRATLDDMLLALAPVFELLGAQLSIDPSSEAFDEATADGSLEFSVVPRGGRARKCRASHRGVEEPAHSVVAGTVALVEGLTVFEAVPYRETDTFGYIVVTEAEAGRLRELLGSRFAWMFEPVSPERPAVVVIGDS